jgi:hypothetical protein
MMNAYRNAVTTILKQMLLLYSATRTIEFLRGISRRCSPRPSIALFTSAFIEMVDLVIPYELTWDFCGYSANTNIHIPVTIQNSR